MKSTKTLKKTLKTLKKPKKNKYSTLRRNSTKIYYGKRVHINHHRKRTRRKSRR